MADLDPEDPVVVGDPAQIQQVLFNLAFNARDALLDWLRPGGTAGGTFRFSTRRRTLELVGDLRPGPYVELSVADDGLLSGRASRSAAENPRLASQWLPAATCGGFQPHS